MKSILLFFSFLLCMNFSLLAQELEAKSVRNLLDDLKSASFAYKGRGVLYGYNTTQSCLYVNSSFVIIKNYCYPNKPYPAKSFTLISKKYGLVEFYQESLESGVKHDVQILAFSNVVNDYFQSDLNKESIESINVNFEKIYGLSTPACWSTNKSYSSDKAEYDCYLGNRDTIMGLDLWFNETQALTNSTQSWEELMTSITSLLKKN